MSSLDRSNPRARSYARPADSTPRARSHAKPAGATPRARSHANSAELTLGRRLLVVLERIVLGVLTIILSVNIWTGFPLLALWVGARFAAGNGLSMGGIVMVILALGVLMFAVLRGLTWLSLRYDRITGRPAAPRRPAPWLSSMSGGHTKHEPDRERREVNAIETIVVLTVVAGFIAFEIWFFFFAGTALPHIQ